MQTLRHFILLVTMASVSLGAATLEEAKLLLSQGKLDEAQQTLQQLIAAEPQFAHLHYELGSVFIERKDFAAADREFTQVAQLGQPGLSLIGRGRVQMAQEKAIEAKELLDQAQKETPTAQELMDQIQAAETDAAKADRRATAAMIATLYYQRGLANALLRDYAASTADLETSLKLDPNNAKAHYYAGLGYNALKRPDMLVSHFQEYLKMEPEGPESARVRSVLRGVR